MGGEITAEKFKVYKLYLNFSEKIISFGIDPLSFLFKLAEMGDMLEVNTNICKLPDIFEIEPKNFYLSWTVIFKSKVSQKEIEEIFAGINDKVYITIKEYDEDYNCREAILEKRIGEVLVEKGFVTQKEISDALKIQKRLGEILIKEGKVLPPKIRMLLEQQKQVRKVKELNTINVSVESLNQLLNLVDQLTQNHVLLSRLALPRDGIQSDEFFAIMDSLQKVTQELKDNLIRLKTGKS